MLPVSCVTQKLLWWITEEFRPTSTTPGPGNSSNILLLLDTCGLRIALIHNGYHRAYLQRRKKVKHKTKKKEKKNEIAASSKLFGISRHDLITPLAVPTIAGKNKSPQKLFHRQTMLLHHDSHYHSMAFRCQNPYLSLFNLNCGFGSLRPSLVALEFRGSVTGETWNLFHITESLFSFEKALEMATLSCLKNQNKLNKFKSKLVNFLINISVTLYLYVDGWNCHEVCVLKWHITVPAVTKNRISMQVQLQFLY